MSKIHDNATREVILWASLCFTSIIAAVVISVVLEIVPKGWTTQSGELSNDVAINFREMVWPLFVENFKLSLSIFAFLVFVRTLVLLASRRGAEK